jgi:type IV pilus assembly protein PilC
MPKYIYSGVTPSGKRVNGEIEAGSRNEIISLLRKKKVRATSIKNKPLQITLPFKANVKLQDISRFTRQFAAMTSAGLPLVQCLDILSIQTENKTLSKAVHQISLDIQGGNNLADAMAKHPKIFNNLYTNMVAAGEASGTLDVVLNRLAEYQEKSEALRRKIRGAMFYPAIVGLVAIVSTVIMLVFIVPTFSSMFADFGSELPLPTQIVIALSAILRKYFLLMLIIAIGLVVAVAYYYRTEKGRLVIDTIKLKLPVFGDLERKSSISRFSQTLSTLLNSGITILEALSITARTAGNKVLELGLMRTLERISGGLNIAEPLKETGVFPPMVIHMISVGEKTGDLAEMLQKISEFYSDEVDAAVEALTSVIEPILIVFMGIVIGGILIAMYLPMFDMIGKIQ